MTEDSGTTAPDKSELPPYFAVSLFKFAVMSICTFGFYEIWWFYVNWCRVKRREQSNILPAWRAVFAGIWCYACLARIRTTAVSMNLTVWLPAGPLTIVWIITSLFYKAHGAWALVSLIAPLWLLPAQAVSNRINRIAVPEHDPNNSFRGWNWLAIVLGGGMMALAIIGSLLRRP